MGSAAVSSDAHHRCSLTKPSALLAQHPLEEHLPMLQDAGAVPRAVQFQLMGSGIARSPYSHGCQQCRVHLRSSQPVGHPHAPRCWHRTRGARAGTIGCSPPSRHKCMSTCLVPGSCPLLKQQVTSSAASRLSPGTRDSCEGAVWQGLCASLCAL